VRVKAASNSRATKGSPGDGEIDPAPWLGGRIHMGQVDEGLRGIANPLNPIRLAVDRRLDRIETTGADRT
jgi:hypothetical protein